MKKYPLSRGDVAVVDRGLCHASGILEKQQEGADVIARYNPTIMPLYKDDGTSLDIIRKRKTTRQPPSFTSQFQQKFMTHR